MSMKQIKESDLYEPVRAYLSSLGYDVKGEVKSCDITAVRGNELIVVELKKGFTAELLYQAIDRQKFADSVYVAIPFPKRGYKSPHYNDMLTLCKRLELGLILVGFSLGGIPQTDVVLHPCPAAPVRRNNKKRRAVISEHTGRSGSVNIGGVSRKKILTVYKEQSLIIAELLANRGELSAREVHKLCGIEKTSSILRMNYYRLFEKIGEGRSSVYRISDEGLKALEEYKSFMQ